MHQSFGIPGRVNTPVLHIFYVHIIEVDAVGLRLLAILAQLRPSLIESEHIASIDITRFSFYEVRNLLSVGFLLKSQDLFRIGLIFLNNI